MTKYTRYRHWDEYQPVWVKSELKGKHREHCLCFDCTLFHPSPEGREQNCPRANELYDFCVKYGMTTPVWECPDFIRKT